MTLERPRWYVPWWRQFAPDRPDKRSRICAGRSGRRRTCGGTRTAAPAVLAGCSTCPRLPTRHRRWKRRSLRLGSRGGPLDARDNLAAGPVAYHRGPASQRGKSQQRRPHGRHHVLRAVPRSRHDVRHRFAPRPAGEPAEIAQRAPSVFRSGFCVPETAPPAHRSSTRRRTARSSVSRAGASSRTSPARRMAAPSSPTPGTTRTSWSPACRPRCCSRTTGHWMNCAWRIPGWAPRPHFAEARRLVTWHYQSIILHEFLPQLMGASRVSRVLADRDRHYRPKPDDALIPVELRLGYTMARRKGSMPRRYHRPSFPCGRTYTASLGRRPASERCRNADTVRFSIRWSCSSGSAYTRENPELPRSSPRTRPSPQRSANSARVATL